MSTDRRIAEKTRAAGPGPQPPARIAAGVEDTPAARDAAALGSTLAHATGAELILVAVDVEPLVPYPGPKGLSYKDRERHTTAVARTIEAALPIEARVVVQPAVVAARGLRDVTSREHRDLLVVGSAHDAKPGRVRLGRHARELLSELTCPLAVAPRGLHERSPRPLERIAAGFDGTPGSRAAVIWAAALASAAGAETVVCGVGDEDELEAVAAELHAHERVTLDPRHGNATHVLRDLSHEVDLLVLGSLRTARHGRVDAGRTAGALLHDASSPVVLMPRPEA